MSFNDTLNKLKTALQSNSALSAFCTAKWSKALTVERMYKHRVEISLDELPIILITRPHKKSGSTEEDHTVRLYFGFQQEDRTLAQSEAIEFEELIENAVIADRELDKTALLVEPKDTITDEGYLHPTYFGVKDLEIEVAIT
jgi:hypothetical protein